MADWSRFNTPQLKYRTVNAVQNSNIEMMRRSLCCLAERVWVHTVGGAQTPSPTPAPWSLPACYWRCGSQFTEVFWRHWTLKQVHAAGIPEAMRSAEGRTRVCLFLATCVSLRRKGLCRVLLLGQQDSYPCVTLLRWLHLCGLWLFHLWNEKTWNKISTVASATSVSS